MIETFGLFAILALIIYNIKLLQENYIVTLGLVALSIIKAVLLISEQIVGVSDRFIEAYSSKDTIKSARIHAEAVTTGVLEAIGDEGRPGPLCWPFWMPTEYCKRARSASIGSP